MGMQLELIPPERVGPIMIGMDFDEAQRRLAELPGYRAPAPWDRMAPGFAHYESEMSISIHAERKRVTAVEVFRPERGDSVVYRGILVFELPAEQVIAELAALHRVDVVRDGLFVVAPDVLIAMSRPHLPISPDDEDGRYFESVLVSTPGYYSGPDGRPIY